MDLHPLDIVIHIINIIVLYLLLRVILYKPVKKFMAARAERIEAQLEAGKQAEARATELREQFDAKLAEAESQAREIVSAGEKKANENAEAALDEAREQARRIVDEAQKRAEQARRQAVEHMRDDVADAAVELAGRILSREVTLEDNRAVADHFFDGLKQD